MHQLGPLAERDLAHDVEIRFDEAPRTRARIGVGRRAFGDPVDGLDRTQQASLGQVFLAPVVVGDAVRDQADALRDIGERPAFDALLVEQPCRRAEDRLALFLIAARLPRGRRA